jgi:hypothetical protein
LAAPGHRPTSFRLGRRVLYRRDDLHAWIDARRDHRTPPAPARYRARYRDAGGRQHERRFVREVDAQRWLDEATSALVTQTWTAPERGRVTVADWAGRWLASQTGVKPSTLYRYGNLLRTHVLPTWGKHRLADVTHADVAAWVAKLLAQGSAAALYVRPTGCSRCCSASPCAMGASRATRPSECHCLA